MAEKKLLKCSILDPTGNITALVESPVEIAHQPSVAQKIMALYPQVEQVGFLRPGNGEELPELRMAGGEFCGNASMSAAALLASQNGKTAMRLRVSGAAEPVELMLAQDRENSWIVEILMPPALEIIMRAFSFDELQGDLPFVRMEGISHVIIEPNSGFFRLLHERGTAERAVRAFCESLRADGLGLMFLEGEGSNRKLTPLVYVPVSETTFWENACASGSAATGMYLAAKARAARELALREPGGTLWVKSDPHSGETRLKGHVRLAECTEISFN